MTDALATTTRNVPLYEQVAERINFLIDQGALRPGDRAPSIRSLSRQLQVSINTVKEAYVLLEDRQRLEARPQSGFYVRPQLAELPSEPVTAKAVAEPAEVTLSNAYSMVMRDMLNPQLLQLGIAAPNHELLPMVKLNRMLASETRRLPRQAISYEFPPGNLRLRQQIAQRLLLSGCSISPDQLVITSGCVEAVALALRAVCKPGDTIAIETPFYFNFLQLIKEMDLKTLEIPASPRGGISLEALDYALQRHPQEVKACLVISNFNNPLGSMMADADKEKLVDLLARHQVPLIEDDIYGDLAFTSNRPKVAKAFDKNNNVLLCSSFSKTLAPGYRVGWVAAGRYQEQIEIGKMISGIATASPPQLAVAEFLATGGYDHHLRTLTRNYAKNVACMSAAIGELFPAGTKVSRPAGGHVIWVEMPLAVDGLTLYRQAKQHGITIAPGQLFSQAGKFHNCIRLNASYWNPRIEIAIATLSELVSAQLNEKNNG
jgi:DNA-binding transcriptional MocR family regulator